MASLKKIPRKILKKKYQVRLAGGTTEFFNLSLGKRDDDYSSGATCSRRKRAGAEPKSANSILLPLSDVRFQVAVKLSTSIARPDRNSVV